MTSRDRAGVQRFPRLSPILVVLLSGCLDEPPDRERCDAAHPAGRSVQGFVHSETDADGTCSRLYRAKDDEYEFVVHRGGTVFIDECGPASAFAAPSAGDGEAPRNGGRDR